MHNRAEYGVRYFTHTGEHFSSGSRLGKYIQTPTLSEKKEETVCAVFALSKRASKKAHHLHNMNIDIEKIKIHNW
jgi:hypothetical protein